MDHDIRVKLLGAGHSECNLFIYGDHLPWSDYLEHSNRYKKIRFPFENILVSYLARCTSKGTMSQTSSEAPTANTPFRIGSISKVFTSLLTISAYEGAINISLLLFFFSV